MTERPDAGIGERLAFSLGARREVTPSRGSDAGPALDPVVPGGAPPDPPVPAAGPSSAVGSARASARSNHAAPAEPRDWAFIWTLVFTGVLFLRPQDVFPPLEVLHLAELSALAGLVSLIVGRLSRRQTLTRMTPEFAGVLALGVVILLTAPFSIWFGGAVGVFTDVYLKVALIYLLAVNVVVSPKRIERLTWLLVLALGYIAFRGVFDYARGVNIVARGTRVQGAVGGLVQNPNDLALHMVTFLPLALLMAMSSGSWLKRILAVGAAACMLGAIVVSGSRGGFIGFAFMFVVLGFFAARQRPMVAVAGVFVLLSALPLVPDYYWRRVASITDSSKDDYGSSEARRKLFSDAFDAFVENPFTGVGAGQFYSYKPETRRQPWQEAHNIWLQVAADLGFVGFAVFTFLVARAFGAIWQTRRLLARVRAAARRRSNASSRAPGVPQISAEEATLFDAHSAAMAAALVGFFVCAFFSSIAYHWTFYYLLVLAVAPRDVLRERIPVPARRRVPAAAPAIDLTAQGVRA